jgi:predicted DNA-binding helix-hairpin-helix protein
MLQRKGKVQRISLIVFSSSSVLMKTNLTRHEVNFLTLEFVEKIYVEIHVKLLDILFHFKCIFDCLVYINKLLVEGASRSNHHNFFWVWIFKIELVEKWS